MSAPPSRCPHCQAELPEWGRFCVMCGRRIEGWGGLIAAPDASAASAAVPEALPSEAERTRPSSPPKALLLRSAHGDEESQRPTKELPSVGHELRAAAPDHRVHTSPTGNLLPSQVATAVTVLPAHRPELPPTVRARPEPTRRTAGAARRGAEEGAPRSPMGDDQTDVVRLVRQRPPPSEALNVLYMVLLCGGVALFVGLIAYRLLTRPPAAEEGHAVARPREVTAVPASIGVVALAGHSTSSNGLYRTRDLVVGIAPPPRFIAERRRGPNRPTSLPPVGPTTPTTLDSTHHATDPAPSAASGKTSPAQALASGPEPPPPAAPLSKEEQQREAEAQLAAADIEFVASTHNVQVRQCYERAFKDSPGGSPGGKVELAFTLSEEGRAVSVSTVVNTTGSERLGRCLEGRISEWRFPRPIGGAKAYQFPFVFLAQEGAAQEAQKSGAAGQVP